MRRERTYGDGCWKLEYTQLRNRSRDRDVDAVGRTPFAFAASARRYYDVPRRWLHVWRLAAARKKCVSQRVEIRDHRIFAGPCVLTSTALNNVGYRGDSGRDGEHFVQKVLA